MNKIYRIIPAILLVCVISAQVTAQPGYWTVRSDKAGIVTDKAVARISFPKEFKLFDLNIDPLRGELFTVTDNRLRHSTIISLPNADGGIEQFEIFEASNFAPSLQARFPEIRAFSGKGITDKYATLKLSISPQGIQTMVFRTERDNEFIEPYSQDHTTYAVFRSQREKGKLPWTCTTEDQKIASGINNTIFQSGRPESNAGELKTMRLAQSCNGEYSNYFGAFNSSQVALVLAAFNATLTRCNGCYEKDLAIHLNLIAETVNVIFYDPATDPYTTMGQWNNQLQATLTSIIGDANYDIGHMFGASGGGGNAGCIGCVCVDGQKGRGITSPADGIPQGDNFDIDYVVHEVGHQMGGNHTFSHSNEGTGRNKEVGAGITIMGYAGITSYDPAPHSIDIFHETSIEQIQANMATKSCPVTTNITANNATPVIAPVSNYTIPISTPFALTGSATDANPGDALTYCWEQNDNGTGQTGANSVAYAAKPSGPNWLTFPATTSPTRYFPRLSTIQAGLLITPPLPGGDFICNIEALSSVSRTLNFRLTVRDNSPYSSTPPIKVGQTAFTDMTVTVTNTSGPFQVTSPNTAVSWQGGTSQAITWNVNNTTAAPVSCTDVKISLSTDGGITFPNVLIASTPNDGSETLIIPGIATSAARIKVEAVGNIFFDISDANFTITAPVTGFTFNNPAPSVSACPAGATMSLTLGTNSISGFSNPITLSATAGVPPGTNVSFDVNPVTPGNNVVVTLNNTNILSSGSYVITITGVATGSANQTRDLTFTITGGTGPAITGQPSNQAICAGTNTSFSIVSASATAFQWQVNPGTGFVNVINGGVYSGAATATLNITGATAGMNAYQYRCMASVQCGSTTSSSATLTVNTFPAITGQPQNNTLCTGSNHTFSVTATGAGLTYLWQENTGSGFVNITNGGMYSGATTASLTLTGITSGMNSYQYRCIVSGTCSPSATSSSAILTVVSPVTVSVHPSNSTICEGSSTSFTAGGSGSGVIYQWQVNPGSGFVNITNGGVYSGAGTATLLLAGPTTAMNGYQFRCQMSNATCTSPATTNAATLTINILPFISNHPSGMTLCAGSNHTFNVTATGTGISYQWQVNPGTGFTNVSNGGVYSGATSASLVITGTTAVMTGYQYQCIVTGTCSPAATSVAATLTVIVPPSITAQPSAAHLCSGNNTSFDVTGTSTQTILYQWQVNPGTGFVNLTNTGVYSGATTKTLSITGATASMSGYIYQCLLSNVTCTSPATSATAALTVRATPTVSLAASPLTSLAPGQITTLTATPSAATGGVLTTTWLYNTSPVTNTGNTRPVNVEQVGNYQVQIQESWSVPGSLTCSGQSQVVTIDAPPSPRLFIFPSPNDGRFTISYYNESGASLSRSIVVYDSRGARVFNRKFTVSGAYTLLSIDLQPGQAGVYYVVVGDATGKKIIDGKVLVQ